MHEEVFPALVETYYAALYRFALSLAKNPSDACDLTQQTFFVWATKGHTLRDESKAKTWLFTTLYREFLRGRRRGARLTAIDDLAALQEVDEAFREPVALFYLQDLSYLEIAEILSVPIGTVMSRLSRGKAQLRARLAQKAAGGAIVEFPRKNIRP
jgi:RNA polymerase sigma-70 factor, ECF subfamily